MKLRKFFWVTGLLFLALALMLIPRGPAAADLAEVNQFVQEAQQAAAAYKQKAIKQSPGDTESINSVVDDFQKVINDLQESFTDPLNLEENGAQISEQIKQLRQVMQEWKDYCAKEDDPYKQRSQLRYKVMDDFRKSIARIEGFYSPDRCLRLAVKRDKRARQAEKAEGELQKAAAALAGRKEVDANAKTAEDKARREDDVWEADRIKELRKKYAEEIKELEKEVKRLKDLQRKYSAEAARLQKAYEECKKARDAAGKKKEEKVGRAPEPEKFGAYLEGYLGYAGGASGDINTHVRTCTLDDDLRLKGVPDHAVQGGLRLGTWFASNTFLGRSFPEWGKYFGFYTDFSFQRFNFRRQFSKNAAPGVNAYFGSEGVCATLAFMFAGRFGLLPDQEVPFGRLQPYVAVGPGILFASQEPKLEAGELIKPGSNSDVAIALVVDCGFRYMVLSNVFVDIFFRYRYAQPNFTYDFCDPHNGQRYSFSLDPAYHQLSGNVGVGVHW